MFRLVNHPAFTLFIFIVIGLNTITLSMDVYQAGSGTVEFGFLEYTNYIFFIIFTLELIVKVVGLGLKEFVKDKFNIFDAFIVAISLIEIILASGSGTFTSLRAFRLFRVFKLFRVGGLRIIIDCLTKTVKAIFPFIICLTLFMYIFTLMGMQFFAGKIKFDDNDLPSDDGSSPRYNFNTFFRAFLSVFIILTGENWNEMMYDAMRSTDVLASFYFIIVIVMGSIIMLQLLVAILINNFDDSHKLAEKRRIIDAIEARIQLGKPVKQAIKDILGAVCQIEDEDDDPEQINVRIGKSQVTIKKTTKFNEKSSPNGSFKRVQSIRRKSSNKLRSDIYKIKSSSPSDKSVKVTSKYNLIIANKK